MADDRDRHPRFSFGVDPNSRPVVGRGARRGRTLAVLAVVAALLVGGVGYLYLYEPERVRRLIGDSPLSPPARVTRAYKWRGADGGWHITDEPPAGVPYETIEVRSDTNILPAGPKR